MGRNLQRGQLHARINEVPHVVEHVEANQVRVEEALDELQAPGEGAVDLGRREGRVQEPADVAVRLRLAQHLGDEHQVVVVHPHVVVVLVHLQDRLREELVRLLVGLPEPRAALVDALVEWRHDVVEERPEHIVRKPIIIFCDEVLWQEHGIAVLFHRIRGDHVLVSVRYLSSRPSNPNHVEAALETSEARHKAAGAPLENPLAFAISNRLRRQPVCNNEDLLSPLRVLALQLRFDGLLEVLLLLLLPDVLLHQGAVL
mmetsp:Transcript_8934/g.25231  ORF Transcript_8934/g.25231 Transcript_8934/m.25231 type:complete len:258 (+) Transcript_8934:2012-2785(+)